MTGKASAPPPPIPLYERPIAPEFVAHDVGGFFIRDGMLTLTFQIVLADHAEPPGNPQRAVAGRVTLPIVGGQRLALGLYDFLKKNDLDPSNAIPTEGDPSKPQ